MSSRPDDFITIEDWKPRRDPPKTVDEILFAFDHWLDYWATVFILGVDYDEGINRFLYYPTQNIQLAVECLLALRHKQSVKWSIHLISMKSGDGFRVETYWDANQTTSHEDESLARAITIAALKTMVEMQDG